jgi:hypothetical protein
MNYNEVMDQARNTNKWRDQAERDAGLPAESDRHPYERIITAMMAIEAGIKTDDWSCIAEGQALLESACRDWKKRGLRDELSR